MNSVAFAESTNLTALDAITKAKEASVILFQGEAIEDLGLEEVAFKDGEWHVTLGFSRPWDQELNAMTLITGKQVKHRTFKLVRIRDTDGRIVSVVNKT